MEVEHIAGKGLPPRGPPKEEADGTVGHGVLGKIVVDNKHVPALVHKVFAHGRRRIGGQVLEGRGI